MKTTIPEIPDIPDKLYFKIGEVSELIGVKPYVLRYWETEFRDIAPVKSRTQQRLYRKQDVELIFKIKDLLYNQRFTINGARQKLKDENKRSRFESQKESNQLGLGLADDSVIAVGSLKEVLNSLKVIKKEMTQGQI